MVLSIRFCFIFMPGCVEFVVQYRNLDIIFSTKCYVFLPTLLKYSANVLDEIFIVCAINQEII